MRDNTTIKFKLAELLEAVAIIGVLVAISIPIFTSQLEKAREATDEANIRSLYAECSTAVLTGATDNTKITITKADSGDVSKAEATYTMTQKTDGLANGDANIVIGGVTITSINVFKYMDYMNAVIYTILKSQLGGRYGKDCYKNHINSG